MLQVEEVQVVAYGTQQKTTVTGAISSVKTEDILKTPSANIVNTLAGSMPGLLTVQNSGMPGDEDPRIFIRGAGTLSDAASSPLILVDGVERNFSQLDPNEIADITVLKDASSTAVFGVRGANGVILVTTRRGKKGDAVISVTSSMGLQQPTRIIEMADSYTFAKTYNQMLVDDGGSPAFSDGVVEAFRTNSNPQLYPNINWNDYVLRNTSFKTQHNLNISGGSEKVKYFVSSGLLFQDGVIKDFHQDYNNNFAYTRFNYRANLDIDLTKSTLFSINIGGWFSKQNQPKGSKTAGGLWNDLMESKPYGSPGIIDGKLIEGNNNIIGSPIVLKDPLTNLFGAGYFTNYENTLDMDAEIKQDLAIITKGLSFSMKGSYNTNYSINKQRLKSIESYTPWEQGMIDGLSSEDPNYDRTIVYSVSGKNTSYGYSESTNGYGRYWYLEAKLNYDRTFGSHKVTALALFNESKRYYPSNPRYIPLGYLGLVGRASYSFKSKYLLDVNVGYNGSENFAPGKTRYGLFPALSMGWIISEEPFMKNINLISYMKLRGSYGIVGSDRGGSRFMYINGVWDANNGNFDFGVNPTILPGAAEGKLGNPDVTWETSAKQNYGIDLKFFNAKLSLTGDLFFEKRKDILITLNTAPQESAINLPNINMGRVNNHGYELSLGWRDGKKSGFSYFVNANVSFARNKIIEMDEIIPKYDYLIETGGPTGRTLGYHFLRYYEESDFTDGVLNENLPIPAGTRIPGDPMFADLNNDGVIDAYDQKYFDYGRRPEYVFGLNFGFSYKGFDISTQWTGVTHVVRNLDRNFRLPFGASTARSLAQYTVDNAWTPEKGQSAKLPRITSTRTDNSYVNSDLYLWDSSYLRLRNIEIGYTFKGTQMMRSIGVKNLKVYLNGLNLLTFDKIKAFDPEIGTSSANTEESIKYPIMKIYNLGINVNF